MSEASHQQTRLAQHVTNRTPRLETIEVSHMRSAHDVYGGRSRSDGELRHMGNTEPGTRGWLGNPYLMDDDADDPVAERRRVIAAFLIRFLDRVEEDPEFAEAVEELRGDRVACWCRGVTQDRDPSNWCHLDVVDAYLADDLDTVREYLREAEP